MTKSVLLRGYRYSVYNRIARVALHEKGVAHDIEEVDPFAAQIYNDFMKRQPFGRVPVLSHGTFDVYETSAIVRYVDVAFNGPILVPSAPEPFARAAQVVSILDSYGYRPMVRQVFEHRVFRPTAGEQADYAEVLAGLEASETVLTALNNIAAERLVLDGRTLTIADCHLAPMIAYFVQAPEGADALSNQPALSEWWESMSQRPSIQMTNPGLP